MGPRSQVVNRLFSRLDVFLMSMPPKALDDIVKNVSIELVKRSKKPTNTQEVLRFIGVVILATKFEFRCRKDLWSTTALSKYIPAPKFGSTGIARDRFDDMWACFQTGNQPPERPDNLLSEAYRWLLVDGFVDRFNEHRAKFFSPSDRICVDESISQWYGQGGYWINAGLPMYVAIDRKPENGCEIQNSACGRSGVMLRLKLVKTKEEEETHFKEDDTGLLHGTKVLKYLVEPWVMSDRIVCADSYFASIPAALELRRVGLRFIGVVKTAKKMYPMSYLSQVRFATRGDRKGLLHYDNNVPAILAYCWMDRERRYFVATAGSLNEGKPYDRFRWRQVDQTPDASPERVNLIVPQPEASEIYYDTCGKIDQHNRHRQKTLQIERKLKTTNWAIRVNMTILGMIIVDTWLIWKGICGLTDADEDQKDFYTKLSEELIDNDVGRARKSAGVSSPSNLSEVKSGVSTHLTPTKRSRKDKPTQKYNNWCRVCRAYKTKWICSDCLTGDDAKEVWICHSETGRACFAEHVTMCHND